MGRLGVSVKLDFEENKKIIAKKWVENPELTEKQVRYLLAVWKASGNYEYAKKLYDWFKRASVNELRNLAGAKINSKTLKDFF